VVSLFTFLQPYWKVTPDGSARGNGVVGILLFLLVSLVKHFRQIFQFLIAFASDVGVLEANFIEPAHDKQDFERSSLFIRLETKLKQILMDYWFVNMCPYYKFFIMTI
jgi:hypothetical protein